ncbi:amidase signature enzyme, partial [Aspergillus ruber CBS 135680]
AQRLDEERANGTLRSHLHGVPIVVKDNYNTDPELGMNTTAGSYSLLNQTVTGDAFVVSKLRSAGLLILGKANLDEFAGMMGKDSSSGFSSRGGQASAAYVVGGFAAGGDPSGSSGGSAIAVSAGFAAASLGTDTDDSIVKPACRAALFGLRPSTGLTSRSGVVPLSLSQDSTGPLAKSTWDVAALLSIMAVHDEEDSYSQAAEPFRKKDYTAYLKKDGFKGLRIGVPRYPFFNASITGARSEANGAIDKALLEIQKLGATVIDPVTFPNAEEFTYAYPGLPERSNNETILLQYDLKEDIAIFLQTQLINSTIRSLQDIINYNEAHSDLEFPPGQCCQATFLNANNLPPRASSAEYWIAQYHQQRLDVEGMQATMRQHDLDLFVVPTEGYSARMGAIGKRPVGTVPLGYDGINLPFGLAFVGRSYDEGTVLRAMYASEKAFPKRQVPPTLD